MPTVWFALKRSLHCKSEPSEVHDPKAREHLGSILTRKAGRSGCSRSIANLRDVIHGSKRHIEKPPSCSPRSIGSSEFINPITHDVILNNSRCELRISGLGACHEGEAGLDSPCVGTLRPGTPGPGGHPSPLQYNPPPCGGASRTPARKCPSFSGDGEDHGPGVSSLATVLLGHGVVGPHHAASTPRFSHEMHLQKCSAAVTCHKCGEKFVKWETLEAHHLTKHAGEGLTCASLTHVVSELVEGDSSRKIVEMICRTGWSKTDGSCGRIERVLKVHNMQKTLTLFEEYRETVKMKASKLPKKHPRCLADGNELLRFHGTTIACSLGMNGSPGLCASEKCSVCQIIRHGFSGNEETKGGIGVFTTSTSGRALESIETDEDDTSVKKALLVCRVIAGRVHKPLDNYQELVDISCIVDAHPSSMDSHQLYGLTGANLSCEHPSPRNLVLIEWTLDSTKSALGNSPSSPLSSQFECDNLSVPSNIQDQHSSTDTIPGVSLSGFSPLDTDSRFKLSQVHLPEGIQIQSNSLSAASSQSMRHVLQEIETALMAPDTDEPTTSTDPELKENKQTQLPKQRSRTWTHEIQLESPSLVHPCYLSGRYLNPSHEVRPEKRLREMRQPSGNDVKQHLIRCAETLSKNKIKEFELLVEKARSVVSITGVPIQRLGAYMLEGLVARHKSSGTNIHRALRCREPESKELLSYMRILYDICPYFKFGYMAANGAIADALKNEDRIHIIDFQIAQGTRWITLIQALAARPGGPPHVRITAIDDPMAEYTRGDGLHVVGKMLLDMSKKFNIPLEFKGLPVYEPEVTKEMLDVRLGEALAVNFTLQLHHTPDESVDLNNPGDGLLRLVKSLSPKVMTLVEQESNTNTTPLSSRFVETLDYYSAMFESVDVMLPKESKDRINVEQHCLAKDIVNIIAREGKDRIERHELLSKWRSRLSMAGFRPYPLSPYVNSVIKTLLGYYSDKYTLMEKDGALLLGWKNRNIVSASAWH
ncbi:unnamed protein product [Musa hybrid cultivar]